MEPSGLNTRKEKKPSDRHCFKHGLTTRASPICLTSRQVLQVGLHRSMASLMPVLPAPGLQCSAHRPPRTQPRGAHPRRPPGSGPTPTLRGVAAESSCPSELAGKATDFCRMSLAFLPGHFRAWRKLTSHTREHARSGFAARPDVGGKLEQHLRGDVNDGLHQAKNAEQINIAFVFAEASAGTSRRFRSEISFASILAFPTSVAISKELPLLLATSMEVAASSTVTRR